MTRLKFLVTILLLMAFSSTVLAQQDCPTIVQTALAAVDSACSATARNQACYGNIRLDVTPREGNPDFHFTQAGDITDVASIEHLQLSSFDTTDESWGIALMKLQANLPNTLPGQNVIFLLFGDVEIENEVADAPEVTLTAVKNANVRAQPTTTGNNVIGSLKSGQEVITNGRLADDSWVRIKLEGDAGGIGWVATQLIEGELDGLAVIEPQTPVLGPMQSFYFKTGTADRPCDQAPDSGILVQSPQGASRVSFTANGVDITLGSTVYMQSDGNTLTISVVEGSATLEAAGQTQIVPAGSVAQVPLGADGLADEPPAPAQPYDAAILEALPLDMAIWETVTVAPALSPDELAAAIATLSGPQSGTWSMVSAAGGTGNCRFNAGNQSINLTFSDNGSLTLFAPSTGASMNLSRTGDNTYSGSAQYPGESTDMTFNFTSPTTYTGTLTLHASCDGTTTISGTWSPP